MGRNTNTSDIQPLDNTQLGQLAQIQGQALFYNTGSSKWLRTGSYTAASNLTTAMKANLAAQPDLANAALITANERAIVIGAISPYSPLSAQRISASSVSVFPAQKNNSYGCFILAVTSAGAQIIPLALTSYVVTSTQGGNVVVASNNTTIFAYTPTSSTAFGSYSTTNGTTWASAALTGLPAFASLPSTATTAYGSGSQCTISARGRNTQGNSNGSWSVFWCGARFIMVVTDNSLMLTSTSTTGLAWSGDTTTAVLGSALLTSSSISFYRNGNACILGVSNGSTWRYTTDGGVTWAACPTIGGTLVYTVNTYQKVNASTAAKLFYYLNDTTSYWTANTGATWTARTLPFTPDTLTSAAYMGTTALLSSVTAAAGTFRSVDDGATWTPVVFPIGTLTTFGSVFADSSRFYFIPSGQNQILTSSDAITWTITTVTYGGVQPNSGNGGIISFSSNSVLIGGNSSGGSAIFYATTDGGVTWIPSTMDTTGSSTTFAAIGDAFITADGLGGGTAVFGGSNGNGNSINSNVISKQTLDAGAQFYRAGNSVSPTNASAFQYMRVE
jgi:hypothetical protein